MARDGAMLVQLAPIQSPEEQQYPKALPETDSTLLARGPLVPHLTEPSHAYGGQIAP